MASLDYLKLARLSACVGRMSLSAMLSWWMTTSYCCILLQTTVTYCLATEGERETYTIGFLPSIKPNENDQPRNRYFFGAFIYALDKINNDDSYRFRLKAEIRDNKADTFESIRQVTQLYDKTIAFIGPEDTCNVEARMAGAYNLPMVAYVSSINICLHLCE